MSSAARLADGGRARGPGKERWREDAVPARRKRSGGRRYRVGRLGKGGVTREVESKRDRRKERVCE